MFLRELKFLLLPISLALVTPAFASGDGDLCGGAVSETLHIKIDPKASTTEGRYERLELGVELQSNDKAVPAKAALMIVDEDGKEIAPAQVFKKQQVGLEAANAGAWMLPALPDGRYRVIAMAAFLEKGERRLVQTQLHLKVAGGRQQIVEMDQ
jgi:hypothetical protein